MKMSMLAPAQKLFDEEDDDDKNEGDGGGSNDDDDDDYPAPEGKRPAFWNWEFFELQ